MRKDRFKSESENRIVSNKTVDRVEKITHPHTRDNIVTNTHNLYNTQTHTLSYEDQYKTKGCEGYRGVSQFRCGKCSLFESCSHNRHIADLCSTVDANLRFKAQLNLQRWRGVLLNLPFFSIFRDTHTRTFMEVIEE